MGRLLNTKVPWTIKPATGKVHREAKEQDRPATGKIHREAKEQDRRRKSQRNLKRRAKTTSFVARDRTLIKQQKTTIKSPFDPKPYTVTNVKSTQITTSRGDQLKLRNMAKCKLLKERPEQLTLRKDTGSRNETDYNSEDENVFIHLAVFVIPVVILQLLG